MTTPFPILIFNILITGTLQFAGVLAVGFMVWRWIAPKTTKTWAVVATPFLGAGVASAWLNIFSPIIGWRPAVWIFFGFGLVALWRLKSSWRGIGNDPWWPALRKWGHWVLLAALALSFTSGSFDIYWHLSFMAEIANGAIPPPHPQDPTLAFTYHYGFEIVAAATHFAGWPLMFASAVWQGLLQAGLLASLWVAFRSLGVTARRAAAGTLLVAFVGTLGYLVRPFRSLAPEILSSIYPFHNTTMVHSLYLITFMKSTLPALGIMVLAMACYHARVPFDRKRLYLVAPVLLAAVALSNETILVFVAPFLFLGLLIEPSSRGFRIALILTGMAGMVLSVAGPGLIRDMVFGFFQGGDARHLTALVWHPTLTFPTFYESPLRLGTPLGLIRFLLEYGARFFLAAFALKNFQRASPMIRILIVAAVIMFLIPFFFDYLPNTNNLFRVWIPAFLILAFYGAREMLSRYAKTPWWHFVAVPVLIFGGFGSTILVNVPQLGLYWSGDAEPIIESPAFWKPSVDMKTRLSKGSVLGTTIPLERETRHTIYQQYVVFGVPMQLCLDPWGAKSSDVCQAFLDSPSEQTLRAFGITHLVATPKFVAAYESEEWFKKNLVFLRRFDPPAWTRRFSHAEESFLLYQVLTSRSK